MEREAPSFEESFGGLQETVEQLEQGGLALETALDLFERGMLLASSCQRQLDQAELRLTRLVEEYAGELEALEG
jgi:exodeoxyribonuclease VII small subunit